MCVYTDVFIFFLSGFPPFSTQRGVIVIAVLPHTALFYMLSRLSKEQQQPDSHIASMSIKNTQKPSILVSPHPLPAVDFFPFFRTFRGGHFCLDLSQLESQALGVKKWL